MKEDYQKALKKLTFSPSNPVPFIGQYYENQKRPGTSGEVQKSSLIMDILPDQV